MKGNNLKIIVTLTNWFSCKKMTIKIQIRIFSQINKPNNFKIRKLIKIIV